MRVGPELSEGRPTVTGMDTDSLVSLGMAVMCEACESEIDLVEDVADRGICRHCGVAFLLDADPLSTTASASA